MKDNFKDFHGVEKVVTLKFKGFKDFQDAYEPCILQFSSGKSLVLILQYFDHS